MRTSQTISCPGHLILKVLTSDYGRKTRKGKWTKLKLQTKVSLSIYVIHWLGGGVTDLENNHDNRPMSDLPAAEAYISTSERLRSWHYQIKSTTFLLHRTYPWKQPLHNLIPLQKNMLKSVFIKFLSDWFEHVFLLPQSMSETHHLSFFYKLF